MESRSKKETYYIASDRITNNLGDKLYSLCVKSYRVGKNYFKTIIKNRTKQEIFDYIKTIDKIEISNVEMTRIPDTDIFPIAFTYYN